MRSLEAVIQASWITRRSKITQLLKKMIEIINQKKSDVVPPLPPSDSLQRASLRRCMFLFIPYFVAPACVSQQSAFQRALIKNANNVRFTSAAPQRPESEREGEEETLSHPVKTECVRRRETGVHRRKWRNRGGRKRSHE